MYEYVFVCIGTNKIVSDSFGPRVGDKLENSFKDFKNLKVFGTMKKPIHFKNAKSLANKLYKKENVNIILIDSALGAKAGIGDTFVSFGGIEIGKAYGKSFYFPAKINIKTVIANKNIVPNWKKSEIDLLAQKVAMQIKRCFA